MKRVLITAVHENSTHRDHRIGTVTKKEFLQLKELQGSTLAERTESIGVYPVLTKIYVYRLFDDDFCAEEITQYTKDFTRVEDKDVADYLCHHIIWEAFK